MLTFWYTTHRTAQTWWVSSISHSIILDLDATSFLASLMMAFVAKRSADTTFCNLYLPTK